MPTLRYVDGLDKIWFDYGFTLQRASVFASLIRNPSASTTGWAQVGLSATTYLRISPSPFGVGRATRSCASGVNANSVEALVSIAALSPPRGEPVHCVAPVRASRQKICP